MKAPRQKLSSEGRTDGHRHSHAVRVGIFFFVAYIIKPTQDMHKVEGTSFSQLCPWMNLDSSVADLRPDLYFQNF
jgi:hypothetical protein